MISTAGYSYLINTSRELVAPFGIKPVQLRPESRILSASGSVAAYSLNDVQITGPITVLLPSAPIDGSIIYFTDNTSTISSVRTLTINANGKSIDNSASPVVLSVAGGAWQLVYVNAVNGWKLSSMSSSSGGGVNIITFNASGTYTPSPGMKQCIVRMVGGGGGGGGVASLSPNQYGIAESGGCGAYVEAMVTASQVGPSQLVTIGTGGAGGPAGNNGGSTGTATTFGSLLTAGPGSGGLGDAGNGLIRARAGALGGTFTITTGANIASKVGSNGAAGYTNEVSNGNNAIIRTLVETPFGLIASIGLGPNYGTSNGTNGPINSGVGGTGAFNAQAATTLSGGAGGSGRCLIIEYF